MLKMAIDSGRSGRSAQLGELFASFTRFPAYLAIGLIMQFAVPGACLLVVLVAARLAGPERFAKSRHVGLSSFVE